MKTLILLLALVSMNAFAKNITLPHAQVSVQVTGNSKAAVKNLWLEVTCLRKAWFWEQLNNGMKQWEPCYNFSINSKEAQTYSASIRLEEQASGQYELPALDVDFSGMLSGVTCMRVYADVYTDGNFGAEYVVDKDQYALATLCSQEKWPHKTNEYVWNHNRARDVDGFLKSLSKLTIKLK